MKRSVPYKWKEGNLDDDEISAALNERVQKEADAGSFSGAVLIARGDKIIFEKAYGNADAGNNIINTLGTRFHTGSLGKMITAAAVAQLVEKGKLKFSDTLGSLLPDYPNRQAASSVTVSELLTHTAGIADPFELGRRKSGVDYSTPSSNFPLFADAPLTMAPGSRHRYSNGNYAVLAAIVEKLSGLSFEKYLQENIFAPAGMSIGTPSSYKNLPRAVSYHHVPEIDPLQIKPPVPVSDIAREPQFEYSGFSLGYLTITDVYKFLKALRDGKIVSPRMVETITSGKVSVQPGAPAKYGYGFYDSDMWGVNMRGHSGGGSNSGIGADAEMIPQNNYYVVVLGNCDLEKVRPVSLSICRFLGTQK